ncbi:hypothetical protein EBU71_14920 [bacterium]|nr:hypothetical protein [Candidatus Elulimicrobium humile]
MALKYATNNALSNTTALPSAVPTDNLILISTQTASNSANISFTTGLNGTYDMYEFKFINIQPSTNDATFQFNGSTDSGSNYNVTKTTTFFHAYHDEADTATSLGYDTSSDLAQSTGYQTIHQGVGNSGSKNSGGSMQLFNPSSTTYVKHFILNTNRQSSGGYSVNSYVAGYFNTTSAVNAINFKFDSGNISSGTIKLYGVKKS